MFASSEEVDKFIRGLNDGTIRILPEANNILVDDKDGNKQTLAKRLADAIKEYEHFSVLPVPPPTSIVICKAAISEVSFIWCC